VFTLITFLKGRLLLGLVSIFVPLVGVVCALRLAKPHSAWSHWIYSRRPELLARSHKRFDERDRRWKELKDRLYDVIGGAPSPEQRIGSPPPVVAGHLLSPGVDENEPG
jgi:hypothetical protein